ncbi:hypothetical protein [Paenibacillus psychroresistens]|uniref:hypothetical protein n=1 Tax=Paenibacillus psychroresistens TaxID=1778678 RepID=UPI0012DABA07|nr:hypothetical protein [Paenibacillus psychroresistens]
MDKNLFDGKFNAAFQNALHRSFSEIKLPEPHIILESWVSLQKSLAFNQMETQKIEK